MSDLYTEQYSWTDNSNITQADDYIQGTSSFHIREPFDTTRYTNNANKDIYNFYQFDSATRRPCPDCGGSGQIAQNNIVSTCQKCKGTGDLYGSFVTLNKGKIIGVEFEVESLLNGVSTKNFSHIYYWLQPVSLSKNQEVEYRTVNGVDQVLFSTTQPQCRIEYGQLKNLALKDPTVYDKNNTDVSEQYSISLASSSWKKIT